MKRFFISITLFLVNLSFAIAANDFDYPIITLTYNNSLYATGQSHMRPRTPANPPIVYIDGRTILFETAGFCNSVEIVDLCTNEVVYETIVSEAETQVSLPEELRGEYEIHFCRETYYYAGIIEL